MTARVCLPVSDWPLTDREAWNAAHRRGGLLEDDGLAANWAPATSSIIAEGYGRFLYFLIETEDYDPSETPAMRITRLRVENYVAHLRERNHSSTVAARALQLTEAMRIMVPDTDWRWLRRVRSRLQRMSTPARDDRARLVPAATVFDFHRDLIRRAEKGEGLSDLTRALMFRDGVLLGVFSVSGICRKNMASIAIGSSLQRRGGEWWLIFRADEMKNKRPYERRYPASPEFLTAISSIIALFFLRARCRQSPAMHSGSPPAANRQAGTRSGSSSPAGPSVTSVAICVRFFCASLFQQSWRSTTRNMSELRSRCSATPITA